MPKTKRERNLELIHSFEAATVNRLAEIEGPSTKKWTRHDLLRIEPLTENQRIAFKLWREHPQEHLALFGSAGCGKSFISIYLAMTEILRDHSPYRRLKIVRNILQTRQIGAIPGTLDEKKQPIFDVYADIFAELFGKESTFKNMCKAGFVELIDTSYIRGSTWDDCIIFIDEAASLNDHETVTVLSRIGATTRVIIAGDRKQCDLNTLGNRLDRQDYDKFIARLDRMPTMHRVDFTRDDICRSEFVRQWIIATEEIP